MMYHILCVSGSRAIAISAGSSHTCAVLVASTVMCWGQNENGQLGVGNLITTTIPVIVNLYSGLLV